MNSEPRLVRPRIDATGGGLGCVVKLQRERRLFQGWGPRLSQ
jgi:hypothetical protein